MEKQPDRAAVWTFQEAEAVGGSDAVSFNCRANGKVNALQQQGRNLYTTRSNMFIFHYTTLLVVPLTGLGLVTGSTAGNAFNLTTLQSVPHFATGKFRDRRRITTTS
jgi:hypothetical protein